MSGISSTLSIAKTALASQQYGLNVTGQNIANVNNKDYSVQTAEHINRTPAMYAGFLFGTGVDMSQIKQNVDALLEERLTGEISNQASLEEQESYIRVLEDFFDPQSANSLTTVMTEFWNSWHDLSNNPKGTSERIGLYESGAQLASRFKSTVIAMDDLVTDISYDIRSAVGQINSIAERIANLNKEITSVEGKRSANDQRDLRHALVDELGKIMDIDTFEQPNGAMIVNGPQGFPIVNGVNSYRMSMQGTDIVWKGTSGSGQILTSTITTGKIGGLLEMRDRIVPKYKADVNELAKEMIWAVNYQQSQGVGLQYYESDMTGQYASDDSKWLTSLDFGNKIDFTKDFTMWTEDKTEADTKYTKIQMDMSVSQARITNWKGATTGGANSMYRLTVVDGGNLGDKEVMETNGDGLGQVIGSTDPNGISQALDRAIAKQNITVSNAPGGITVIDVADAGGDARRSAASIAQELNKLEGVSAYASKTSATLELTDASGTDLLQDTHDGDIVSYTLYVDGILQKQSFVRDSSEGSLQEQFEESLLKAATAINELNEDLDLSVEGLTINSEAGKTIGVENFSVTDNAGIQLNDFTNFNSGDVLTFTIQETLPGSGSASVSSTEVTVDLQGIDTQDQELMAQTFYDAMSEALGKDNNFSVIHNPSDNGVIIRSTNGSGIRIGQGANDTGNDAIINISPLTGSMTTSALADQKLKFDNTADPSDDVRYDAIASSTDQILFSDNGITTAIHEANASAGDKSAVVTGTISILTDKDIQIGSNISGPGSGSLFAEALAPTGSSILTFGGKDGFTGFSSAGGETISFTLDGHNISLNTTATTNDSDIHIAELFATEIENDLTAAGVEEDYQIIRMGSSVSVLKKKGLDDPIVIKDFSDSLDHNAKVRVSTGTGAKTNQPENDFLDADLSKKYRNTTTSTLYNDKAIIQWERLDKDGIRTGASGLIHLEDETHVVIEENQKETISFDISKGSLVAGNVLTMNTDKSGRPDPINFQIKNKANSVNELYHFTVESGGKVGHLPDKYKGEEPLVIKWKSSTGSGEFTIEGHDPPQTPRAPVDIPVDGMILKFYDGTLRTGDVFTITTDNTGTPKFTTPEGDPTGETMTDWHWTMDSFAQEFNRHGNGIKAFVTQNNKMQIKPSDNYYALTDIEYSGQNGFSEDNVNIKVTDWNAIDFKASSMAFQRSNTGVWGVVNDATGGKMQILPEGGDDDGFGVDFSGDGIADIRIDFDEKVSGEGFVRFDFTHHDPDDLGYAFGDNTSNDSGVAAALGLNTFFAGKGATSMGMDKTMSDSKMIGAARIDSQTGIINQGDNSNALGISDVQFQEKEMKIWTYNRHKEEFSKTSISSIDNFFNSIVSSMGVESRKVKHSRAFADRMVSNVTEQRDAVSAVSLDEEVIKLIRYQHAYGAASKLLTTSDEMLATLIDSKR